MPEGKGAGAPKGRSRQLPPLLAELRQKYPGEEFGANDTLYAGEKDIICTSTYGERMRLLPAEKMKATPAPPRTLPRPRNCTTDLLDAVREGKTEAATPFEYGARLTELTLLANLAQHAGKGQKVEWDGPNMKVTNNG